MNVLVVLAHPNRESLNHAIAATAVEELRRSGHEVWFHDLYDEQFDPLLTGRDMAGRPEGLVAEHIEHLTKADGVVIIHPNWWGQAPAIMKGWIDRVFRNGVAYRFEETAPGVGVPVGLLKASTALVLNTANSAMNREWGSLGDPLENMWNNMVLGFCGISDFHRRLYAPVLTSRPEQREAWLTDVRVAVREVFAPAYASASSPTMPESP